MDKTTDSDYRLPIHNRLTATLIQTHSIKALNPLLPYVDLCFTVIGQTLPVDHGYGCYAALNHLQSKLHYLDNISIQTISGIPDKHGSLHLNNHSRLRIRLPADQVPLVYPFGGKSLTIGKHTIRLGIPEISLLQPEEKLRSRIVVITGYEQPEAFLAAAQRQLKQLGIQGTVSIPANGNGNPKRRTVKIKRYTVVGFSLEVTALSDEDSLILQIYGIGGKQKMGCGVFVPVKKKQYKTLKH
jgi:CRISPR-associated protein Cas6